MESLKILFPEESYPTGNPGAQENSPLEFPPSLPHLLSPPFQVVTPTQVDFAENPFFHPFSQGFPDSPAHSRWIPLQRAFPSSSASPKPSCSLCQDRKFPLGRVLCPGLCQLQDFPPGHGGDSKGHSQSSQKQQEGQEVNPVQIWEQLESVVVLLETFPGFSVLPNQPHLPLPKIPQCCPCHPNTSLTIPTHSQGSPSWGFCA